MASVPINEYGRVRTQINNAEVAAFAALSANVDGNAGQAFTIWAEVKAHLEAGARDAEHAMNRLAHTLNAISDPETP